MQYLFQELRNPTDKDLFFKYDSATYTVKAGGVDIFADFIARHGAGVLADINWQKPLDLTGREALINSYLGKIVNNIVEEVKPSVQQEIEMQKQAVIENVAKEEEFADLKEEGKFVCDVCQRECKNEKGLAIHKGSHK